MRELQPTLFLPSALASALKRPRKKYIVPGGPFGSCISIYEKFASKGMCIPCFRGLKLVVFTRPQKTGFWDTPQCQPTMDASPVQSLHLGSLFSENCGPVLGAFHKPLNMTPIVSQHYEAPKKGPHFGCRNWTQSCPNFCSRLEPSIESDKPACSTVGCVLVGGWILLFLGSLFGVPGVTYK